MNNLFILIKSMSKSEKRHFKLFTQAFGKKDSVYLKLFDAIDKQEEYDEAVLTKKMKVKHLSPYKKFLFENILKTLRIYHAEHNEAFQLIDNFQNISLLRNRGLFKDALRVYERTYKKLKQLHLYTFLVELLNTGESLWLSYLPNKEMTDKLVDLQQEKLAYIEYAKSIVSYRALARDIKNMLRILHPLRSEEHEAEIFTLLQNPLLQDKKEAQTIIAQSLYYECQNMLHMAMLDYERVKIDAKEAVVFLEAQDDRSPVYYKTLVANLVTGLLACAKSKDDALFQELEAKYEVFQKEVLAHKNVGTHFEVLIEKLYYNFKLHYWIEQNDFETIIEMEEKVVVFWKKQQRFLDSDWRMTVGFFFAQAFFFNKQLDKAQAWVDILLDEERNNPKIPCICNARILNLMIQYEKKNFFLLYSLFCSTKRYLNKNERIFKGERVMLNFFKWVGENEGSPHLNSKLDKLTQKLKEVCADKYEKNFFQEMKLEYWLNYLEVNQ